MEEFVKEYIKIVSDYEYGDVYKNFTLNNGIMVDGVLILKSEETLKRLIYNLRVFSRNRKGHRMTSRCAGALKRRKPPQTRWLLSSLAQGKKRAPSETFLKTLRYHSMQNLVLSRVCA